MNGEFGALKVPQKTHSSPATLSPLQLVLTVLCVVLASTPRQPWDNKSLDTITLPCYSYYSGPTFAFFRCLLQVLNLCLEEIKARPQLWRIFVAFIFRAVIMKANFPFLIIHCHSLPRMAKRNNNDYDSRGEELNRNRIVLQWTSVVFSFLLLITYDSN